ncbi:MAG TPA: DivIVA domain-containing protein, partial [Tissierellaceae bacterium]
ADSVDEYLDILMEDYSTLHIENKEYKARINVLQEQIEKYKDIEDSLKDAVLVAQTTGEDIIQNAEKNAENIIKSANLEREAILNSAQKDVENLKEEYEILRKEVYIFKTRFESFLKSQLMTIEDFMKDID